MFLGGISATLHIDARGMGPVPKCKLARDSSNYIIISIDPTDPISLTRLSQTPTLIYHSNSAHSHILVRSFQRTYSPLSKMLFSWHPFLARISWLTRFGLSQISSQAQLDHAWYTVLSHQRKITAHSWDCTPFNPAQKGGGSKLNPMMTDPNRQTCSPDISKSALAIFFKQSA